MSAIHSYVGFRPCGCAEFRIDEDTPDRAWLADRMHHTIISGGKVEYLPVDEARIQFDTHGPCRCNAKARRLRSVP